VSKLPKGELLSLPPYVQFTLAIQLINRQDQQVLELLDAGQERHPDDLGLNLVLGYCYANLPKPRLDKAEVAFASAVSSDPKNAVAHNNLGKALHDQKALDKAVTQYRLAIQCESKFVIAHFNLAHALQDQ